MKTKKSPFPYTFKKTKKCPFPYTFLKTNNAIFKNYVFCAFFTKTDVGPRTYGKGGEVEERGLDANKKGLAAKQGRRSASQGLFAAAAATVGSREIEEMSDARGRGFAFLFFKKRCQNAF